MPHTLRAADVTRDLATRCIGVEVRCLDSTASTNDAAFDAAARGAPEGTVVTAEVQTGGRGRHGRLWRSPAGGLWCSVLLRPALPPGQRTYLTVLGAAATAAAVESAGVGPATIRWPNDVMLGGKKVAGILVEVRDGPDWRGAAVVGIGVNVSAVPDGLPPEIAAATTALNVHAARRVDRIALLRRLLQELDAGYAALCAGETEALDAAWRDRSGVLGARVRLTQGDAAVEGRVVAVGATRGVTLETDGGGTRTYRSEHITRLEVL